MPPNRLHTQTGRIGIVDIGSNSIRLVVYDRLKRAPTPLYNEKVLCQLGKGLAITGKLNPNGVELARAAIARFLAMARVMEVTELDIIATAAVRDATDGKAFVEEMEKKHGVRIETISGTREAKLGAFGICASVHQPKGIAGDLGGGSMELVRLDYHELQEQITLPIGPLRLIDQSGGERDKMKRAVMQAFDKVDWLERGKTRDFYAIGGTFRAIAKMHMFASNYPLKILHQYTLPTKALIPFVRELTTLSESKIAEIPGSASKRLTAIPPAAMVLLEVMERVKPANVVFSASGIREGYLYEKLSPYIREEDPLITSCTEFSQRHGRGTEYAHELFTWMAPLFPEESARDERLRFAACLLHDIAAFVHPEHRAEWAMQRILQSAFTGFDHQERVQLALTVYHRYQYKLREEAPVLSLITPEMRAAARLVGATINLAYHLAGGVSGPLPDIGFKISKEGPSLKLPDHLKDLMGDAVKKRLSGVTEAWMGLQKAK